MDDTGNQACLGVAHPAMHRSIPSPGCKRERSFDHRGIEASPKGVRAVWEEAPHPPSGCHGPTWTRYCVVRPLRFDRVLLGVERGYDSRTSIVCVRKSKRADGQARLTAVRCCRGQLRGMLKDSSGQMVFVNRLWYCKCVSRSLATGLDPYVAAPRSLVGSREHGLSGVNTL
jgi:hypothetical protein